MSNKRPLRADALRNRDLLLEAAKAEFSAGGADASLEGVARRAGVGIGTLYRHFPTREALYEAVYRREVDQLADLALRLTSDPDPATALRGWLHEIVAFVATKKGMSAALAVAADSTSHLISYSKTRLTEAISLLLGRAVAAGQARTDLTPEDLLRALVGMSMLQDHPGWQDSVARLLDVFIDGLTVRPTTHASGRARSTSGQI